MKDQDRYFKKRLGAYTVAPADETEIQKTIFAGKQLCNKSRKYDKIYRIF